MEPRPQVRTERRPSAPTDRPGPHSLDAERAVLSACLRDETAMGEALGLLAADDFYHPRHRAVFAAIVGVYHLDRFEMKCSTHTSTPTVS